MPCGPGNSRGRWGGAESLAGTGFPGRSGSPQHSAALRPDLALGGGGGTCRSGGPGMRKAQSAGPHLLP